jgi:hypothetical protein
MLKDYKVGKAYEYFSSGWLQEGYFLKAKSNNNNLCILRTKCSPSQTLMNLLGTFQPRLPIIGCNPFCYYLMVLNWHCIDTIENLKNMHKFHTLQCKNNKLLLSIHHLLWRNIYTLWGSSSSVGDGEHYVLKDNKRCYDNILSECGISDPL